MHETGSDEKIVMWRVTMEENRGDSWVETTVRVLGTELCAGEIIEFIGKKLNANQRIAGLAKFQGDDTHYLSYRVMEIFRKAERAKP